MMKKQYFRESFLEQDQVKLFREILGTQKDEDLQEINTLEKVIKNKNLEKFLLNDKFFKKIKSNLKTEHLIFLNRVKILKNRFQYETKYNWHKDCGKKIHSAIISKNKNFYFKVGVYLQKNDKKLGGGVDILKPFFLDNLSEKNIFKNFLRKIYYSLKLRFTNNICNMNSGDIVGFSGLVFHRTTPTRLTPETRIDDKYSFYFLITNASVLDDVINIYNKDSQNLTLENNLKKIKINNSEIDLCSDELTRVVEEILSA